jgi:hypothetical protein
MFEPDPDGDRSAAEGYGVVAEVAALGGEADDGSPPALDLAIEQTVVAPLAPDQAEAAYVEGPPRLPGFSSEGALPGMIDRATGWDGLERPDAGPGLTGPPSVSPDVGPGPGEAGPLGLAGLPPEA